MATLGCDLVPNAGAARRDVGSALCGNRSGYAHPWTVSAAGRIPGSRPCTHADERGPDGSSHRISGSDLRSVAVAEVREMAPASTTIRTRTKKYQRHGPRA